MMKRRGDRKQKGRGEEVDGIESDMRIDMVIVRGIRDESRCVVGIVRRRYGRNSIFVLTRVFRSCAGRDVRQQHRRIHVRHGLAAG